MIKNALSQWFGQNCFNMFIQQGFLRKILRWLIKGSWNQGGDSMLLDYYYLSSNSSLAASCSIYLFLIKEHIICFVSDLQTPSAWKKENKSHFHYSFCSSSSIWHLHTCTLLCRWNLNDYTAVQLKHSMEPRFILLDRRLVRSELDTNSFFTLLGLFLHLTMFVSIPWFMTWDVLGLQKSFLLSYSAEKSN